MFFGKPSQRSASSRRPRHTARRRRTGRPLHASLRSLQLESLESRQVLATWDPAGPAPFINGGSEKVSPNNENVGAVHAVPVREARATGLGRGDYWRGVHLPLIEACRPYLGARLAAEVDRLVGAFEPLLARAPRTLVHGDISGFHTLIGPDGSLRGVIDFGYAAIGDPALDLAGVLNDRSRAFLGGVVAHYPRPLDPEAPVRAEAYIALAPLFTLRTAAAEGDLDALARARRHLARGVRAAVERGGAGPYHRPTRTKRGSRVGV